MERGPAGAAVGSVVSWQAWRCGNAGLGSHHLHSTSVPVSIRQPLPAPRGGRRQRSECVPIEHTMGRTTTAQRARDRCQLCPSLGDKDRLHPRAGMFPLSLLRAALRGGGSPEGPEHPSFAKPFVPEESRWLRGRQRGGRALPLHSGTGTFGHWGRCRGLRISSKCRLWARIDTWAPIIVISCSQTN